VAADATVLPPPAVEQQAAVAAATAAPVAKPATAAPATAAADKPDIAGKPRNAALANPVKPEAVATAPQAKSNVETVTDKAVAAVNVSDKDAAQATPDQSPDPSALLALAQNTPVQQTATDTPKVTPHTVAHLAAQIASNVDGKTTRFDVTLNPEGLGKVDVRVEIGAKGDMTAQLNFANADAAAQMQQKAPELQAALQQAGFDPSRTTLSFNSGGGQQGWQDAQNQQQNQGQSAWTGRAFTTLSDQSDEAVIAPSWARRASGGVDVRI
jgi:flagellar hook-length control protein FliK